MHRVTGNSKRGRQLIARTSKYRFHGNIWEDKGVSPKPSWKFVELLGRNGHKTVAKIREHHFTETITVVSTGQQYNRVVRPNYLE